MSNKFEFYSGLRGYHVYHNTVNWRPYVKEKIALKREHNNEHDKFAVAGRVTMRGRFGWIVVGHIPKEPSRYLWYSIHEGAKYDVEVYKKKPMTSPLLQGGLEIPIKVFVTWDCLEKLSILVAKVKDVQYPITGEYIDSSKDILHDLGVENDVETMMAGVTEMTVTMRLMISILKRTKLIRTNIMMKHNNGIVSHLIVTNTSFLEEIKTRKHVFTHLSQFKGFWISLWKSKDGQN